MNVRHARFNQTSQISPSTKKKKKTALHCFYQERQRYYYSKYFHEAARIAKGGGGEGGGGEGAEKTREARLEPSLLKAAALNTAETFALPVMLQVPVVESVRVQ